MFDSSMFKAQNKGTAPIRPLMQYLSDQEELLKALGEVLTAERTALRDRLIKDLPAITERKSSLMINLQSNDQRIKLHPDAALLKTTFAARVENMKKALLACKTMNEINGKLLNMCANSCHRVSAMLMGARDRLTSNMTYTDKGRAVARGPMRLNIVA